MAQRSNQTYFSRNRYKDWKLDELKNRQEWIFTNQEERSRLKITLLVMKHDQERFIQENQWMSLLPAMRLQHIQEFNKITTSIPQHWKK